MKKKALAMILILIILIFPRFAHCQEIKVGSKDFQALVIYIEKNGSVVKEGRAKCDRQIVFIDSHGNLQIFATLRRNSNGDPAFGGVVNLIRVLCYRDGIKDEAHFFAYQITEKEVLPLYREVDGSWKDFKDVKIGYQEFLDKIYK